MEEEQTCHLLKHGEETILSKSLRFIPSPQKKEEKRFISDAIFFLYAGSISFCLLKLFNIRIC